MWSQVEELSPKPFKKKARNLKEQIASSWERNIKISTYYTTVNTWHPGGEINKREKKITKHLLMDSGIMRQQRKMTRRWWIRDPINRWSYHMIRSILDSEGSLDHAGSFNCCWFTIWCYYRYINMLRAQAHPHPHPQRPSWKKRNRDLFAVLYMLEKRKGSGRI